MAKIKFRDIKMGPANRARLLLINSIIEEYQLQGYVLTLRQLYYQLVSRDIIPNAKKEYSKLSSLLKEGRMAGVVDWNAIEDRLRRPDSPSSWDSPADILKSCVHWYACPRMEGQAVYLEVWVEKDALSGVLKRVTEKYHVPILVNRGYSSASAMFDAFNRFKYQWTHQDRPTKVLYLGDFDPSGLDMIRDIEDRITEFKDGNVIEMDDMSHMDFQIIPIALTRPQIKKYNPPPNPAKITDSRFDTFNAQHGDLSWEVDALKPEVLHSLLENAILKNIDLDQYEEVVAREADGKKKLKSLLQYL